MTYNLYTIYDKVSKECGPVFQAKNFGVAKRYVEDLVKNNPIKLDDYTLYQLASFDSESLKLVSQSILSWDFSEIFGDTVESVEEVKE